MRDWKQYVREHLPKLGVTPEREAEIVGELALQVEQAYTDAMAGGATEPEALKRARAQFPDWPGLAAEINAAERPAPPPIEPASSGWSKGWWQDLRYSARLLKKSPAFAAMAIGTLAFGIGANTTIFTVVDAIALRSLPYPNSDRLVTINEYVVQRPEIDPWSSSVDLRDLRDQTKSYERIAGISPVWNLVLTGSGDAERLESLFVSADLLTMLGVKPAIGRTFSEKEDDPKAPQNVVILSHSLWQRRFGGESSVLGRALNLDGRVCTVIGVMPSGFRYVGEPIAGTSIDIDVWAPLSANQLANSPRTLRWVKLVGLRKPGVTLEQARDEAKGFGERLASQFPESNKSLYFTAEPLEKRVVGKVQTTLFLLLGAVGFVLLMACANVANLLLVRAAGRQKEISVRMAIGASATRVVRQLLTEGFLLATLGGLAGVLLAFALLKALIALGPASLIRIRDLSLDWRALVFTSLLILLCTILAGIPPALRVMRADVAGFLREAGRGLTRGGYALRSGLVVVQIALALTLLIGAGLLMHSFVRLLDTSPGFNATNLATLSTQLAQSDLAPERRKAVYTAVREKLMALPGVQNVGAVSRLPMLGQNLGSSMWIEGRNQTSAESTSVEYRVATPSYFPTMGIKLISGRFFDDHDDSAAGSLVIVNETVAKKFFTGEDPVGKRIKLGANPATLPWMTIVGVIGDIRHFGLDLEARPEAYRPYAASPLLAPNLVIRTASDPRSTISSMATAVRSVNASMPVYNLFRMEELVARSTAQRRFTMSLLIGFAAAALLLAAVGIYGAVSQSVAQRTQEIGIRMALGAEPASALRMVLFEALKLAGIGAGIGLIAAFPISRAMKSLLYEISPLDPAVFLLAAITLGALAVAASIPPARRATKVDPVVALRHE